jgi:TonB family protein
MNDPRFYTSLEESVKEKKAPVSDPSKHLQIKILPDYFKAGLKFSFIVHVGLMLLIFLVSAIQSLIVGEDAKQALSQQEMKNAIRVDVLDLPSMKLSEMQDVDLTKEAAKSPEELPASDDKDKMVLPDAKKEAESAKADKSGKKRIDEIRDQLRNDAKRKSLIAKLKAEQAGSQSEKRQALAGNKLSEGYSLTGDVAKDSDVHAGKVKLHLNRFWKVPAWMANSKQLSAKVVVKLGPGGQVLSQHMQQSSGNADFDQSTLEAIKAADPFPAPPESLRRIYLEEGMLCGFPN